MKTWIIALAAALTLLGANTAQACMPMPGPPQAEGESNEAHAARVAAWRAEQDAQDAAWRHQRQQSLWDEADSVFLARIERVQPIEIDNIGSTQRVTLRAVRSLKGRAYTNRFALQYNDYTSCGPLPGFEAITGAVGDTYVVFVKGGRPRQATVQNTIAPANITDERIRAALAASE